MGKVLIAGGLTLAIVVLPIVVITASEALRAVPDSIREAAFGVGATRWETVRSHVLPYAAPGILTGTILALARAFGETAPLLMVGAIAGTFSNADPAEMLTGSYTALPTIIFNWAGEPQDEFRALTAAAIVVLLVVILLVNAIAITCATDMTEGGDRVTDRHGSERSTQTGPRRDPKDRHIRVVTRQQELDESEAIAPRPRPPGEPLAFTADDVVFELRDVSCFYGTVPGGPRHQPPACRATRSRPSSGRPAAARARCCAASTA